MKILLGNNTLSLQAGSETYILTLAEELVRLGHQVTGYSPELGFIAAQLEALGVNCVSEFKQNKNPLKFQVGLQDLPEVGDFDVIICSHNQITKDLHNAFPEVPIIAIVHGILHQGDNGEIWPEHPVTEFKVDQYVAVSEEVQGLLKEVYNIDSVIISNFFNLEKFNWEPMSINADDPAVMPKPRKPEMFVINSNYSGKDSEEIQSLIQVAKHYEAGMKAVGANFAPSWDMQETIRDADVVAGMGRSVLEGFCMGKIAIVQGRWGTGGVISPESYEKLRATNFSGRSPIPGEQSVLWTDQFIIDQIDKAINNPHLLEWQYKTVLENHNVKVAAKQFLQIAETLIHENNRSN